jgi:hypothetical protein
VLLFAGDFVFVESVEGVSFATIRYRFSKAGSPILLPHPLIDCCFVFVDSDDSFHFLPFLPLAGT